MTATTLAYSPSELCIPVSRKSIYDARHMTLVRLGEHATCMSFPSSHDMAEEHMADVDPGVALCF